MVGIIDILRIVGFDSTLPTKMVRHQDRRYAADLFLRDDFFELYQSYQSNPKFHGAEQIVSFRGLPGTRAMFHGVYKVLGHCPARRGRILSSYDCSKRWRREAQFFYETERDMRFDDLRGRIIIDWGTGALAWVQRLRNKPVLEMLSPGRALPPFDDYLEFSLSHDELKYLFKNGEAHPDWQTALASVAGIYLILAQTSGDLYVGSACGESGIWGRWRDYARCGDGGNVQLRDLIKKDGAYPKNFRFSLLHILPRTMARNEVLKREQLYMKKLGTRATGLN